MSLIRIFAVLPLSEKQTLRWFTFRGKGKKMNIEFFEYID